jgi:hypothetical protein
MKLKSIIKAMKSVKEKAELLESIEVLKIDVHNHREIIYQQNEHILMLYALLEENIKE